jgi:hypothetical protein
MLNYIHNHRLCGLIRELIEDFEKRKISDELLIEDSNSSNNSVIINEFNNN